MQQRRLPEYALLAVFAGSVLALQFTVQRPDIGSPWVDGFWWMGLLLCVALGCYAALLRLPDDDFRHQLLLRVGTLLRLSMIYSLPLLSDDFYRYVWDGRVLLSGANPYDYIPKDWMTHIGPAASQDWAELYAHLNSKEYYSVYPPFLQGIFGMSAFLSGGQTFGAVVVMKCCVVLAEFGSLWLLGKIVAHLQISRKGVLLYALNPLVILELSGNLHTEAFMIVFLLAAIWGLMQTRIWSVTVFLTLAIASKLLPVLLFPYLLRRMPRDDLWVVGGVTTFLCCILFGAFMGYDQVGHFVRSLQLYFQYFQFNAGLHYWVRSIGGGAAQEVLAQILPWIMLVVILWRAISEQKPNWANLPTAMLVALTLYQLHSPVVHPWYLTPLVALAALGKYRFAVLWSCLIPFTYSAYFYPGIQEQYWWVTVEYVLVFGYMGYEWVFKRPDKNFAEWVTDNALFRRLMRRSIPARLRIKQARIARHLATGERILDIGAGHGGLCQALRADGFSITPVDVQNLSLFPDVVPIIYNGRELPFHNGSFDTSLLITMLHHTPDPAHILSEAKRVTNHRLVIMEDIYSNWLQRELTFFTDSLVNLEFAHHPHSNKTDAEWLALFQQMRLKLVYREDFRTLLFFRQVIYVVELER